MATLASLASLAEQDGWASDSGSVESIRHQASALGWEEVSPRRGDPTVSILRPVSQMSAQPKSLSAIVGLGAQPLHTDGAHLPVPPDILVFSSEDTSTTPTLLWRPQVQPDRARIPYIQARHGMFLVSAGRESFFAPALEGRRYRFDPGCMSPCDARAQEVVDYFAGSLQHAIEHDWSSSDQLLIVNNRLTLHARTALTEGDEQRSLQRIAFRTGRGN